MHKLIIYGDIHGCYNEFISLRNKINLQKNDVEVCVGDIITKGKDSIKVLDFVIEHNIRSVLGNHEEKLLRYLKHKKTNKKSPITLDVDEQNIVDCLTQKHIKFLEELPLFVKYENITIVHGGLQNHMDLNTLLKRDKEKLLRMRYLDQDGNYLTLNKEDKDSIFWADVYDGNQGFIVYGHQWFNEVKKNKHAIGIDTGCVYENKLTAIVFTDIKENTFYTKSVNYNKKEKICL